MIVVCSYCKKTIGEKFAPGMPEELISHGMCEECALSFLAQEGMPLQDYVDGLPVPVLALNGDAVVVHANKKALALVNKPLDMVRGGLGGNIFECQFAHLPGGCGRTIHCAGCSIRNTVTETWTTGHARSKVPAYLGAFREDAVQEFNLTISTELRDNVVLLSIEQIEPVKSSQEIPDEAVPETFKAEPSGSQ